MSTFAELKNTADTPADVRKALQGVAFLAPSTAVVPPVLTAAAGQLVALPPADKWLSVGIVNKDGYEVARNITKDEIEGYGYADPVREDITKVAKTLKFTSIESDRRHLMELTYGMDLSAVAAKTDTGEVVFEEPTIPMGGSYRLLAIFMDGTVAKPYYRGFCLANARLADVGSEKFAQDGSREIEITLDALTGPEGFSIRHYIGGLAFDAVKNGFQAATP